MINISKTCFKEEIQKAFDRIKNYTIRTPIIKSNYLSNLLNSNIWIKQEHNQITGSFKIRGATNKLLILKEKGFTEIVTASTGNHGLAVSYMCKMLEIKGHIFIPISCDVAKKQKIESFGGEFITLHINNNPNCEDAENKAYNFSNEKNLPYISPYNDIDIIFGQGTIGYEIYERYNLFPEKEIDKNEIQFDEVYCSVGGGGLISGIAGYIKESQTGSPEFSSKIIGVQPFNSAVMFHSLERGRILSVEKNEVFYADTISDGTAGGQDENSITFEMCKEFVDDWVILQEDKIKRDLIEFIEKEQQIIEGAAAMTISACKKRLKEKMERGEDINKLNVCLVFCGKNISIEKLKKLIQ